ncbi:hypothetical protein [Porphyromonas cangingivalis]|uniref:hypothetical protein n=1 Tax=Porphyromonas cangingivalis TaxID=36874 RepID=UPI0004700F4C|nr:hypothetical protein [Porphyromonas cangingivalis]
MKPIHTLVLSLLAFVVISCGDHKTEYIKESGTRFHTIYHIIYKSDKPLTAAIDSTMTASTPRSTPSTPRLLSLVSTRMRPTPSIR